MKVVLMVPMQMSLKLAAGIEAEKQPIL